MQKSFITNGLVIGGIILYNILFWQEKWGVNSLIFATFILGALYYLYPDSRDSQTARIAGLSVLFTAIMIVVNNSVAAKIVHTLTLLVAVGFVQQRELRFLWFGLVLALKSIATVPLKIFRKLRGIGNQFERFNPFMRNIRLALIPLVMLVAFYGIYYLANPKFAELSNDFWSGVNEFLFGWMVDISWDRVFFIIMGLFVVGGFLWETAAPMMLNAQANFKIKLQRVRPIRKYKAYFSMIGLKNEYRTALMMVVSLNVLLLVVNFIDIRYVWFNFDKQSPADLRSFVHEGTYLLIFAILMAMGIVLFFFRKNINFFPNNRLFKQATYFWIIQNGVLALSVAVRNYRYIDYHGLAYKRIGVIFFLMLTLYGLYTMYIKVRDKKTVYYLLKTNSWALYVIMLLITTINWDIFITTYNINAKTKSNIDIPFLINTVSDKNIWVLEENRAILKEKKSYPAYSDTQIDLLIDDKIEDFKTIQKSFGWQSWNLPDAKNKRYLNSSVSE